MMKNLISSHKNGSFLIVYVNSILCLSKALIKGRWGEVFFL